GGSLDQRAVDRKVLVRKQPQTVSLSDHLIEELQRDLLLQQATAVFAECGLVEARLHQAHVEEPTPQQLEIQFFAERPFAAHRVETDQQRGFEQSLRWDRRPTTSFIHRVERRRQVGQRTIGKTLDGAQWVVWWDSLLQIDERQHARLRVPPPTHPHYLVSSGCDHRTRTSHSTGIVTPTQNGRISSAC